MEPREVPQVRQPHGRFGRERMARRQEHARGRAVHQAKRIEPGDRPLGDEHGRDVNVPLPQGQVGVGVAHARHPHLRLGVRAPKRREEVLDDRGVQSKLAVRELEIGCAVLSGPASAGHGAPCRCQRTACFDEEGLARGREPDPARETMEQRHAHFPLEVADLLRERRLRHAQPALSKQIRDLEREVGVTLFHRLPRGIRLTPAGEAFLVEARGTLTAAGRAVTSARGAAKDGASDLQFAHGELGLYTSVIEDLLATFRGAYPKAQVRVSSMSDADTDLALRQGHIDIASVFIAQWPVAGFDALRLVDCATTGVLLPASHPLAAKPSVRLADLRNLTWLHSSPQRWPGFFRIIEDALRDRGLVPLRSRERPKETPSANVQIAAGETWALASEAVAAPYRTTPTAIVYRPFVEPPIPCWIALVWRPNAPRLVQHLVDVARTLGGAMQDPRGTRIA